LEKGFLEAVKKGLEIQVASEQIPQEAVLESRLLSVKPPRCGRAELGLPSFC
jgi:hypothetical protein